MSEIKPTMEMSLNPLFSLVNDASCWMNDEERNWLMSDMAKLLDARDLASRHDVNTELKKLGFPIKKDYYDDDDDDDESKKEDESESEGDDDEEEDDEWGGEEDDDANYGPCGYRCDGHCQICDPGYMDRMMYGRYDGRDEI